LNYGGEEKKKKEISSDTFRTKKDLHPSKGGGGRKVMNFFEGNAGEERQSFLQSTVPVRKKERDKK